MRIPIVGETYTNRDGLVYLVEKVEIVDPDYWLVTMVVAADFHDMQAMREQYDPDEFIAYCQDEGIVYR